MRKFGITLQIFGGSMCAVAGIVASFSFEHYIKSMMSGDDAAKSMHAMIVAGLEIAVVAMVVTLVGAYLIFYGARVARRAVAVRESVER